MSLNIVRITEKEITFVRPVHCIGEMWKVIPKKPIRVPSEPFLTNMNILAPIRAWKDGIGPERLQRANHVIEIMIEVLRARADFKKTEIRNIMQDIMVSHHLELDPVGRCDVLQGLLNYYKERNQLYSDRLPSKILSEAVKLLKMSVEEYQKAGHNSVSTLVHVHHFYEKKEKNLLMLDDLTFPRVKLLETFEEEDKSGHKKLVLKINSSYASQFSGLEVKDEHGNLIQAYPVSYIPPPPEEKEKKSAPPPVFQLKKKNKKRKAPSIPYHEWAPIYETVKKRKDRIFNKLLKDKSLSFKTLSNDEKKSKIEELYLQSVDETAYPAEYNPSAIKEAEERWYVNKGIE